MRVLVTGASGFAGRHLVRELGRKGWTVFGLVRGATHVPGARSIRGDLTRPREVLRAVEKARPDAAVHLASPAFLSEAERDPARARRVIVGGTANLLESLPPGCRVLLVSTGMVYGPARKGAPSETAPLRPRGTYARLKADAETRARGIARRKGLDLVIARPFNHAGPGQDPRFVVPDFARQVARAESGRAEPVLRVGDLRARRNLTDVRDVVRAYALLLSKGRGIYNVGSPGTVRIGELLEVLRKRARRPLAVVSSPHRRRGTDRFTGSARRIRALGWRPRIPLARTLGDVLSEWRRKEGAR